MNKFSEDNIAGTPLYENPMFVNIIEFLNESFCNIPIVFFKNKDVKEIESLIPLKQTVFMENKIVENNLRMIESYLPEILFALSIVSNKGESINDSIQKLSKNKFSYTKPSFSKIFLRHKMIHFVETILFADIFNGVWKGEFQTNICYVYKEHAELEYYHYYQVRTLLIKLFDKISISGNDIDGKNRKILLQVL